MAENGDKNGPSAPENAPKGAPATGNGPTEAAQASRTTPIGRAGSAHPAPNDPQRASPTSVGAAPPLAAAARPGRPATFNVGTTSRPLAPASAPGHRPVAGTLAPTSNPPDPATNVGTPSAEGAKPTQPTSSIVGAASLRPVRRAHPTAAPASRTPITASAATSGNERTQPDAAPAPHDFGPSGPDPDRVRLVHEIRKARLAELAVRAGVILGVDDANPDGRPGRTEATHQQYLARGRTLVRRYRKEVGLGEADLNPVEFVEWLIGSVKPEISRSSWRAYRQAAIAIIAAVPHDEVESALARLDNDVAEAVVENELNGRTGKKQTDGVEETTRRTSALKLKQFPKTDFDRVLAYLRYRARSEFAPILADWLTAGVAVGLRPIEWRATSLETKEDPDSPHGRSAWLYVLNAKATNLRANGVVRTIDVSSFDDDTLRAVEKMSDLGTDWLVKGVYPSMQSQCNQLLHATCARLWNGRKAYSLYSLRHQFIANAKTYHRAESVSALVGHVVTDTAKSNYAKKKTAWSPEEIGDRPEAVPEEIATVRRSVAFFERRREIADLIGLPSPAPGPRM